eukprot:scaffold25541_cov68-Phaeocystis_antarctica.AAC.1
MAAQLPALQWYVWSPRHEASARLHPGAQRPTPVVKGSCSHLCAHHGGGQGAPNTLGGTPEQELEAAASEAAHLHGD